MEVPVLFLTVFIFPHAIYAESCKNGGIFRESSCFCLPGYNGTNCETPICVNGLLRSVLKRHNYCLCEKGWAGTFCNQTKDSVCVHGAWGAAIGGCLCEKRWQGEKCDSTATCNATNSEKLYSACVCKYEGTYPDCKDFRIGWWTTENISYVLLASTLFIVLAIGLAVLVYLNNCRTREASDQEQPTTVPMLPKVKSLCDEAPPQSFNLYS